MQETKGDFIRRHGGQRLAMPDPESGLYLWPNGARCEAQAGGRQQEPPTDKHRCALVVFRYWELKYEDATARFEAYVAELKEKARANAKRRLPPPPAKELDALAELRDEVREYRGRMSAAKAKVEKTEPAEVKRRRLLSVADRHAQETGTAGRWVEEHDHFDMALKKIKP
jgi:hypothetical protein